MAFELALGPLNAALAVAGRMKGTSLTNNSPAFLLRIAADGAAEIASTDLVQSLQMRLQGPQENRPESGFSLILPTVEFSAFVRSLPGTTLSITPSDRAANLQSGAVRASFPLLLTGTDYLPLPTVERPLLALSLRGAEYLNALEQALKFVMQGSGPERYKGVLHHLSRSASGDLFLTLIATDTAVFYRQRLTLPAEAQVGGEAAEEGEWIAPRALLTNLLALHKTPPEAMELRIDSSLFEWRTTGNTFSGAMLEGQFPALSHNIGKTIRENGHRLRVQAGELQALAGMIAGVIQPGSDGRCSLLLRGKEQRVYLGTASPKMGVVSSYCAATGFAFTGAERLVALNGKYLGWVVEPLTGELDFFISPRALCLTPALGEDGAEVRLETVLALTEKPPLNEAQLLDPTQAMDGLFAED